MIGACASACAGRFFDEPVGMPESPYLVFDVSLERFAATASSLTRLESFCLSWNFLCSSAHFGSKSWMRICSGMSATATLFPVIGSMARAACTLAGPTTFGVYDGTTRMFSASSLSSSSSDSSIPSPSAADFSVLSSGTGGGGGSGTTTSSLANSIVSTTTKSCQSMARIPLSSCSFCALRSLSYSAVNATSSRILVMSECFLLSLPPFPLSS
mmetsp:Transcript_21759/g.61930  ORF Transcript_21759/g.61930 Transcript_21759/m.61930 type:complete len:213 (+) Transcript_21759:737-1375(+)